MSNPSTNNSIQLSQTQPRRTLTGVVTKLVGDEATYGFINGEIFFQQAKISGGGTASVGDQVYAECEYSAHLPIKWNATSVKILNKTGPTPNQLTLAGNNNHMLPPQSVILNEKGSMLAPNSSDPSVSLTYQQYRQQLQMQPDPIQHKQSNVPSEQMINNPIPGRLLPANVNIKADTFNQMNSDVNPTKLLNPSHNAASDMVPNLPMGPPNLAYPNQMGVPFLNSTGQGPYMPTSTNYLNQQQPPPGPPPAHILANQHPQTMLNSSNQNYQQQRQNKSNQRFSDNKTNDNNNRQSGNRANNNNINNNNNNNSSNNSNNNNISNNINSNTNKQNRHDTKFRDRSRSNERGGTPNRHLASHQQLTPSNNNSGPKSRPDNSNRDIRTKRGDSSSRNLTHSTGNSNSPQVVERVSRSNLHHSKRIYDTQNIPKCTIGSNLNSQNIKLRCPSSLHVPSDLKEVIVNSFFRFDIKNIPKPVSLVIGSNTSKKDSPVKKVDFENSAQVLAQNQDQPNQTQNTQIEEPTPPSSKSDTKLNHKYGVKVMLLSMPDLDAMYKHVFGPELDSLGPESSAKTITSDLDNMIQILCNKSSNNGYSLAGGKFDPTLDGFVDGATNDFERGKRQPDLIATCRRVVQDQYNFDLGPCKNWTWLATFVYNNRTDYFSPKASVEYSYLYIPQIWTMKSQDFDKILLQNKEVIDHAFSKVIQNSEPKQSIPKDSTELKQDADKDQNKFPLENPNQSDQTQADNEQVIDDKVSTDHSDIAADPKSQTDDSSVQHQSDVTKADILNVEPGSNLTQDPADQPVVGVEKPEIVRDVVQEHPTGKQPGETDPPTDKTIDSKPDQKLQTTCTAPPLAVSLNEESQLSEGEVAASANATDSESESEPLASGKRHLPRDTDGQTSTGPASSNKRPRKRTNRVELIKDPFIVRPRDPEQNVSLVSLREVHQPGRYDQFELSTASNILKESLILHFSEYILTTLVEDHKHRRKDSNSITGSSSNPASIIADKQQLASSGASSSSQETSSDANNNAQCTTDNSYKNNSDSSITATSIDCSITKQEYPVARYINLAFAYFDANQMGYLLLDDLTKIFNHSQLTISKRALQSLAGTDAGDKLHYQFLPDIAGKVPPTYVYQFPNQFRHVLVAASDHSSSGTELKKFSSEIAPKAAISASSASLRNTTLEFKGQIYDVERLINQVREAEALRVNLVDRFNYAIENSDKQAEEIHVLEVSRKTLSNAIKSQNEEISELKRERDSIKKKLDALRKSLKSSLSSISDLLKD